MNQIDRTLNRRHTDLDRIALHDAREKIIKLEGEVNALRSLLGERMDVIDVSTIDDEGIQVLRPNEPYIEALKVVL